MALVYERAGTLGANGTRSADLLDKRVNKYMKIIEESPLNMEQFFKKDVAKTANFKFSTIGDELDFPRLRDDKQPFPLATPPPGYNTEFDYKTYQLGVASTEALEMFDQSSQLSFILGGLPKAFQRFYEYGMTSTFELAVSTAGSDAVNGFSASHPQRGMGAPVWSNLDTSAVLDSTSVNAMWVNMANRKNAMGFATKMRLKEIIASTKWREKLVQLETSEKVPESNVNATNAYRAMGYTIVETLSSSAPWFGKGDLPEEQWGFHTIEWQAPKITGLAKDPNIPLVTKRYHGYCRVVFGISIPYNFHRNAGA